MLLTATHRLTASLRVVVSVKNVNTGLDGICDKPFQALCGAGELAVFIEVEITGVSES
jgi:hypothetical protein